MHAVQQAINIMFVTSVSTPILVSNLIVSVYTVSKITNAIFSKKAQLSNINMLMTMYSNNKHRTMCTKIFCAIDASVKIH